MSTCNVWRTDVTDHMLLDMKMVEPMPEQMVDPSNSMLVRLMEHSDDLKQPTSNHGCNLKGVIRRCEKLCYAIVRHSSDKRPSNRMTFLLAASSVLTFIAIKLTCVWRFLISRQSRILGPQEIARFFTIGTIAITTAELYEISERSRGLPKLLTLLWTEHNSTMDGASAAITMSIVDLSRGSLWEDLELATMKPLHACKAQAIAPPFGHGYIANRHSQQGGWRAHGDADLTLFWGGQPGSWSLEHQERI